MMQTRLIRSGKRLPETARPNTVFQTEWFSVEAMNFARIKSLRGKPYYRIRCADGVVVLAITPEGKIVLIRQFRPALNTFTVEVPCGHVDASESPQLTAARELYEETGYRCARWNYLGMGRLKMDRLVCHEHAFLGTGAVKDSRFAGNEEIQVRLATPRQFQRLVLSGRFQSWSALALLTLADWKLGLRLGRPWPRGQGGQGALREGLGR
jgi:ADP-ribose pyrophosphatase